MTGQILIFIASTERLGFNLILFPWGHLPTRLSSRSSVLVLWQETVAFSIGSLSVEMSLSHSDYRGSYHSNPNSTLLLGSSIFPHFVWWQKRKPHLPRLILVLRTKGRSAWKWDQKGWLRAWLYSSANLRFRGSKLRAPKSTKEYHWGLVGKIWVNSICTTVTIPYTFCTFSFLKLSPNRLQNR